MSTKTFQVAKSGWRGNLHVVLCSIISAILAPRSIISSMRCSLLTVAGGATLINPYALANTPSMDVDTVFHIAPEAPREIPEFFLGVHYPVIERINTDAPIFDNEMKGIIGNLNISHIRGPGGSSGSKYLWREGRLMTTQDPEHNTYYKDSNAWSDTKGIGKRPIFLRDIFESSISSGLPYVFHFNFVSQTPEEIKDQFIEMRKLTKNPILLELGNEDYEPFSIKAFRNCKQYIAKVRETRKLLKEVDPEVMIGVVCPSRPFTADQYIESGGRKLAEEGNSMLKRYHDWPEELAKHSDAYDAVIIHPYVMVSSSDFSEDTMMRYMYASIQACEDVIKKDYTALFPGKPLWMTEFGILPWPLIREKDKAKKDLLQFCKTPGTAIINMETLFRFLDSGSVTITSLHAFIDSQCFGIVQEWQNTYFKLPNYYIYEAVGRLLKENAFYYRLSTESAADVKYKVSYHHVDQGPESAEISYNTVGAWGFGSVGEMKNIAFANRTSSPIKVKLDGAMIAPEWSYGGETPLPEFNAYSRKYTDPPAICPVPVYYDGADFSQSLELPPYSMTVAKVRATGDR